MYTGTLLQLSLVILDCRANGVFDKIVEKKMHMSPIEFAFEYTARRTQYMETATHDAFVQFAMWFTLIEMLYAQ